MPKAGSDDKMTPIPEVWMSAEPEPEPEPYDYHDGDPGVETPAPALTPKEQAAALAEASDPAAELAAQKQLYNPQRDQPPPSGDLKISARQFVRSQGIQWRHAAGFLLLMKRRMGPMARLTVNDWNTHWNECWSRPVKGPR